MMNNKPLSRRDKVQFLKDLSMSKTSTQHLFNRHSQIWERHGDEPGTYINIESGEELSELQMNRLEKDDTGRNAMTIII